MRLHVLSGGAAEGLVHALAPQFRAAADCGIEAAFGAVGAMRDKLLAGAPADLVILTCTLIDELAASGHVRPGSARNLGVVCTGIAVPAGQAVPPTHDAAGLRAALAAAAGIYFPDPRLATAGIHFAKVLEALGLEDAVSARLHAFPNGATAMRALAAADGAAIGCTQITEILNTPGVMLAGLLPKQFELATVYTAAVCTGAALPEEASRLAALLAGEPAREVRKRLGFAP